MAVPILFILFFLATFAIINLTIIPSIEKTFTDWEQYHSIERCKDLFSKQAQATDVALNYDFKLNHLYFDQIKPYADPRVIVEYNDKFKTHMLERGFSPYVRESVNTYHCFYKCKKCGAVFCLIKTNKKRVWVAWQTNKEILSCNEQVIKNIL